MLSRTHLRRFDYHRLLGDSVEPQLRPLILSITANLAGLAVLTTYFGPWLLRDLHSSAELVADGFLIAGLVGAVASLLGGWLSDRYGRAPVIFLSGLVQVAATATLLLPVSATSACVIFALVRGVQAIRGVGQRALLADLSPPGATEKAFASFRLALHLGLFSGPVIGALLVAHSWRLMLAGACALYLASFFCALRVSVSRPPVRHTSTAKSVPAPPSAREPSALLQGSRLFLLLGASTTGWIAVYSYETVLPLLLVQSNALAPQTWGCIFALGPILVITFQLRVRRWLHGLSVEGRILIGSALMAAAFFTLIASTSIAALVALTIIFIFGDMMWGPASDSIAVKVAPERMRGVYVGMTMIGMWSGSALAPLLDLHVQAAYGDSSLWLMVALLAMVSAGFFILPSVRSRERDLQLRAVAEPGSTD